MYTEKVMNHFRKPKNFGEIEKPDAEAEVGNPACGDLMQIDLKLENGKIKDIKFKTYGCVSAIATASALSEIVKGKTIKEAMNITKTDVADFLGGLPPVKMHCSVLAVETMQKAIKTWKKKQKYTAFLPSKFI